MSVAHQTVLLVEDNPNDVLLLQRTLKKAHLSKPLQVVSSGETAVNYLNGEAPFSDRTQFPLPALVFLDLKLPGMTGFEVLTWIRQQMRFKRTQVVVLTVSRHTLDIYRAFELGANSYLVKPVSLDAFNEMVESLNLQGLLAKSEPPVQAEPFPPHS